VVDDEDRENEGDFIIAAEKITPEKVNFMMKHGRGVLCTPITQERCEHLGLTMQVSNIYFIVGNSIYGDCRFIGPWLYYRRLNV
jgi:3,4-dihydroxy-2-butanone 4-phosphate synthase